MEIECNPFDSKSLHRNYEACIWWQCYQMALLYLLGYFEISASILPRFHMLNSRNFWKFEHPNFSSRFILQKVGLVQLSDFGWKTGFGKLILFLKKRTLVIGPEMLPLWPDWPPDTELFGLPSVLEGLALNAVILCETPEAKVNCSRSSTLVRPLAEN